MGTYDTRGGSPISPDVPEPSIHPVEEEVLSVLEELDQARENAKAVLEPLLLRIVSSKHPLGSTLDVRRTGRVLSGHLHGFHAAKVEGYSNDNCFNYANPECTRVGIVVRLLNHKGQDTEHRRTVWVDVVSPWMLGRGKSQRDILCELIVGSDSLQRGDQRA